MKAWIEEELVGKKIVSCFIKSPTVWLKVEGGGFVEITANGDCCSEAFIDAVGLTGEPELTGEYFECTYGVEPTTQEFDQITAMRFDGKTGNLTIVHRNSSNGYYGNYLLINSRGEPPEDAIESKCWYRVIGS